jgi:preprotein translocase subunit SecY
MKRFLETLRNIWSIEDLRKKIITTFTLILVYRVGSYIILPGVNSEAINDFLANSGSAGGILNLIDMFAGGAFSRASVLALGIMPYISASIIMQIAGIAIPMLQKMQREGESGRRRINQITRFLTIVICALQAPGYLSATVTSIPGAVSNDGPLWWFSTIAILISGTLFVMWIGERITEKGLGNGISLIIMIGIIANLPAAFLAEVAEKFTGGGGLVVLLVEIAVLLFVILLCILLVQGTRRIPIHRAKQIIGRGNRQMQTMAQRDFIPLKVNAVGVMPIIFAQAIMFVPSFFFQGTSMGATFADIRGFWYNFIFFIMCVGFTYLYTAIVINPVQIADDLKRNNVFIPGIKPGKSTSEYIDNLLSRITLPGAIFLGLVAILPAFAMNVGVTSQFAYFYGGTSLLIMVGVVLDTLQQVETHLLNRHYDGLMKSGRIKGRSGSAVSMPQAY